MVSSIHPSFLSNHGIIEEKERFGNGISVDGPGKQDKSVRGRRAQLAVLSNEWYRLPVQLHYILENQLVSEVGAGRGAQIKPWQNKKGARVSWRVKKKTEPAQISVQTQSEPTTYV